MENYVLACGFPEKEIGLLEAVLPVEYELRKAEDVTDLIVTSALCYIVNGENLEENEYRLLRNYCVEVGEYGNERIFWIGDDTPCEMVTAYGSILDFILDIENALKLAQEHHDIQQMYCSEYAVLPARAIADSLEQDVFTAFEKTFSSEQKTKIVKQLRQEWTAILEASAAPELAAVYELCQWLKRENTPYYMEGTVTSGLVPYLLGITRSNPLSKEMGGHNLVWQTFSSYGHRPTFVFHLPTVVKTKIERWSENHWLRKLAPDFEPWRNSTTDINAIRFAFDIESAQLPQMPDVCKEDIFHCFLQNGFIEKDAFRAMEVITLGGFLPPNMIHVLTDHRLRQPKLPSRAELTELYLFMAEKGQREV